MRIRLDDDNFKDLVAGKVVNVDGAQIILADIGWDRMIQHIRNAMMGENENTNEMKHIKTFAQLNENSNDLSGLESHINSVAKRLAGNNLRNAEWAEKMADMLGSETAVHDSGSAGSFVLYLPEDYPDYAVHLGPEGYDIYNRVSTTGDIWKDVPASYMDPKTSEPRQSIAGGDF